MRILFLTHRLPYAPNRGDRIRAFHLLRALAGRAEVELFSLVHDAEEEAHAADLRDLVRSVSIARVPRLQNRLRALAALAGRRPLTHVLLDSPKLRPALARLVSERPPDLVFAYCSGMARFALEPFFSKIPFVLDMVDVDSEKWAAMARAARFPMRWIYGREARLLARFEARAARAANTTLVVNERERAALARIEPEANIRVLGNGVDVEAFRPPGPPSAEPRVVFCGVFGYRPNAEAAIWLARSVWPRVRAKRPEARLAIAGADPPLAVRRLARDPSIEVTGALSDVRPELWKSALAAAPLATARGVQNKVLEAVAAGLPAVVTPQVFEGLPEEILPACLVASGEEAFSQAIIDLLGRAPMERRRIAEKAELAPLLWASRLSGLADIVASASASFRKPAPVSETPKR
jgi:sugar transferase (PEP-CTERM/EpsH1 system associated)